MNILPDERTERYRIDYYVRSGADGFSFWGKALYQKEPCMKSYYFEVHPDSTWYDKLMSLVEDYGIYPGVLCKARMGVNVIHIELRFKLDQMTHPDHIACAEEIMRRFSTTMAQHFTKLTEELR